MGLAELAPGLLATSLRGQVQQHAYVVASPVGAGEVGLVVPVEIPVTKKVFSVAENLVTGNQERHDASD